MIKVGGAVFAVKWVWLDICNIVVILDNVQYGLLSSLGRCPDVKSDL